MSIFYNKTAKQKQELKSIDIIESLTREFGLKRTNVENTVKLIDEGNTIPFIARYRKEATGSLDDQVLRSLSERLEYLRNLDAQREKVFNTISEQGAMTDEIAKALENATTLTEIEDIYRPYKPKKKTRASVAKEKGLLPLAEKIYAQEKGTPALSLLASEFIDEEKGVNTAEEALAGASDIIAEMISDDAAIRKGLRTVCMAHGKIVSTANAEELGVYEMYGEYSEMLKTVPGHRTLAMNRGEREKILKIDIDFDRIRAMDIVTRNHVTGEGECAEFVRTAAEDAYDRLIFPAIEREIRNILTEKAEESAIKLFSTNLRQLLMQPPVKNNVTIGLDPGYRTGCKVAVVDGTGKVLDTGVIFPVDQFGKVPQAKETIKRLVKKHKVTMFAIGNGTASHETEVFAAEVIKELDDGITYMVVSEAGASVYSASKLGAEEFPEFDVSLRSAVSIARRLQDPLSELVKIDPKAIGVGQYQHDMPQNHLSQALDGVVEGCVNSVGVDLNTASAPLLSRVSGIGPALAKNIVNYRQENGAFSSRSELKKVAKLGPKAFEQCAGFLRVAESKNPLDNTAVHPESYAAAKKLLDICGFSAKDIEGGKLSELSDKAEKIGITKLSEELGIGEVTLSDIINELMRPNRDPRDELPKPLLRTDVMGMEDLTAGMELKGTVRNVIDFGAFVDIGVHQDGLVHISRITKRFIKHPSEVLSVGDIVKVWVVSVDVAKKRIALTMIDPTEKERK
ncbi:MAG: RNA-binding transcriptional accessory protein [Clostridia bacterium]|nr:RNA-binding transcriptional accessory protein [Clostridia bacterium]